MIDMTLRLTWRKGLYVAVVWTLLLLVRFVVDGLWHADEPFLTLAATLVVPMWAISAGVYTFANSQIAPGRGWRESQKAR